MTPMIDNEKDETAPPPMTGKASDIPVPSLGTPEPTGNIPAPYTGEISDGPKRSRRGRRSTQEPETAPAPNVEGETGVSEDAVAVLSASLARALIVVFSIAAVARDNEDWNITEKDAKDVADSGAICLAPYMATSAKYVPWAIFGLNLAGVLMPRLQSDAKKAKEEGRAKPEPMQIIP